MQTADAGLLFQSASAKDRVAARERKAARALFPGLPEPVQLNKPLALQVQGQHVWVAEANAYAKKVDIASGLLWRGACSVAAVVLAAWSGKTRRLFKSHNGPVTCLALWKHPGSSDGEQQREVLITGSWDKSIRFYDAESKDELHCIPNAHTDFVKALLVLPELSLLVSGGSDKDVRIWDLNKLNEAQQPTFLASLRSHTRPVDCLAVLPPLADTSAWTLWTADSMGKVCVWRVARQEDGTVQHSLVLEWRPHETAITGLHLFTFESEPGRPADLWTSSADQSVQLHQFDPATIFTTATEPTLRLRIPHPDFVRSVWPDYEAQLLFTGSSDEKLRVWDLEELLQSPPPKKKGWTEDQDVGLLSQALLAEVDEHFHDVHLLAPYLKRKEATGELESCLISGSLDGTLRVWTVQQLQEWKTKGRPPTDEMDTQQQGKAKGDQSGENLMSAEEEAELEALMSE